MDKNRTEKLYEQISKNIVNRQLKDAQENLGKYISEVNDWELNNRYEQVCNSYKYLLHYMQDGYKDPKRHEVYNQLIAETWTIADQVRLKLMSSTTNYHYPRNLKPLTQRSLAEHLKQLESFTDDWAICQLMPDDNANMKQVLQRHEANAQALFFTVWYNAQWSQQDHEEAINFLYSKLLPDDDRRLMVSAVTLSLLICFDSRKMLWLLEAAMHFDEVTIQRALVGLMFLISCRSSQLKLYPEIVSQISQLNKNIKLGENLSRIWTLILMSQHTEEIDKKMREEIIPEMIKSSDFINKSRIEPDNLTEENDSNPDWEHNLDDSNLQNKLREMNELQEQGADIYMTTFKMLKNYAFFHEIPNWFMPFNLNHSTLINEFGSHRSKDKSAISLILNQGNMCDSDKYSLCLTILNFPSSQRDGLLKQMKLGGLNEIMEEHNDIDIKNTSNDPWVIAKSYIQDLYRFFMLNPYKQEFTNIFKNFRILCDEGIIESVNFKTTDLMSIGDFYLKKKNYKDARYLFKHIAEINNSDFEAYQKLGYCWQKANSYYQAIDCYKHADLVGPEQLWNLQHIAECYRMLERYDEAIEYYKKAVDAFPENKSVLLGLGYCLAEAKYFEEAMQCFFKADYMDDYSLKAKRYIAWYSFVMNKNEQAMKYYKQIIDSNSVSANDFLNAGHVTWVMGDLKQAIEYYKQCKLLMPANDSIRLWIETDSNILVDKGILKEDIALVIDSI